MLLKVRLFFRRACEMCRALSPWLLGASAPAASFRESVSKLPPFLVSVFPHFSQVESRSFFFSTLLAPVCAVPESTLLNLMPLWLEFQSVPVFILVSWLTRAITVSSLTFLSFRFLFLNWLHIFCVPPCGKYYVKRKKKEMFERMIVWRLYILE